MTTILETRAISKRFGATQALDKVSIAVQRGEVLAICGENGAGKSTLMKILCGQHREYSGNIRLRGRDIQFQSIQDAERQGISIIHQELNLVDDLSVAANVFLGREQSRWGLLKQAAMNRESRRLLQLLDCNISPQTTAGSLRVGDQQLVEIAKALGWGAEIVIMDEPTSALTESEAQRLDRVIARLKQQGVTILYISHKMDEIFRLADRIAVLRDGRLMDVLAIEQTDPRQVTRLMVGRQLAEVRSRPPRTEFNQQQPVLEVRRLSRRWPGHAKSWRLRDISFQLHAGEILGIAGLMGAGRTELLECLFGCSEDAVDGEVLIQGRPAELDTPADAIRRGIAMVTEDRKRLGVFQNLNVRENITLGALQKIAPHTFISPNVDRSFCQRTIDQLQIKLASQSAFMSSLSGGNQQKCIIGRALLTEPEILLLDDPTRGVDVGAKADIYQLLRQLADDGIAMLITSSELPELLTNCDRILVLCEGVLTGNFPAASATEAAILDAAVNPMAATAT